MNCDLNILETFLYYKLIENIQISPTYKNISKSIFLSGIMDGDLNKKYWTNFDLLKEGQRICTENKLPCFTKGHDKVAVEILDLLGEISLSSSPSQEDKNVITNFKKKYFSYKKI